MIKDFNKIAITAGDHHISYSELLVRIGMFARITPKDKGAKTVIFSENREGWAYAFFSIWNNKGIAVPVDASSTVHDVAYIINDCQPECIWTSSSKKQEIEEAIAEAVNVYGSCSIKSVNVIDDYERIAIEGDKVSIELVPLDKEIPDRIKEIVRAEHPPLPIILINGTCVPVGAVSVPRISEYIDPLL